ncbi:MAG: hypothetical protein HY892_19935 [Deltaproteobacteria bacterium]|nr:hypothetical protein [Deltaproteobacteria bacterium]
MAVAKKAPAKKAVKAPAKKAAPAKAATPAKTVKAVKTVKPAKKAASRLGDRYGCSACGLVLSVVDDCGCGTIDLVCCDTPMKKKRAVPKKK